MALLSNPHWEVVPPLLRELLIEIGQEPFSRRFYLAGGTALALRLGHRVSVDLDFFSETDELLDDSRAEIVAGLRKRRVVRVLEDVVGNLLLEIEGYHVGFFGYGYALVEPPDEVVGVRLVSLADVGLMKLMLSLIVGRARTSTMPISSPGVFPWTASWIRAPSSIPTRAVSG